MLASHGAMRASMRGHVRALQGQLVTLSRLQILYI